MRKTVAVFFDQPGYEDYPFNGAEYEKAYHELAKILNGRDVDFAIVRSMETFLGGNSFSRHWLFDGETFREKNERIDADLIYDKGHFVPDEHSKILNNAELDRVCLDKFATYEMFPDLSGVSLFVSNKDELKKGLAKIDSEFAVVKPQYGEEGKGVMIMKKEELPTKASEFPLILQEFIDTRHGIPGITDSIHDFRIVVINGEVALSYIRTPPDGSLRANVAKGGKEIGIPVKKIPPGALDVVHIVDNHFKKFCRRIYSVDLGLDASGKWKIFELNSKPGLSETKRGPEYKKFLEKLADILMS